MILIIGLGNPGKKYENTRHNVGFRVIDELEKRKLPKKVMLLKPLTFMNESGKAVKKIFLNLKSEILNLFVVHDDIDLPLGKIRISKNRGAGGHKGVESIINELKTKNFVRFRIGIKPVSNKIPGLHPGIHLGATPVFSTENFVLKKFSKNEEKILKEVIAKTVEAIEFGLKEGIEKAMNKYNL